MAGWSGRSHAVLRHAERASGLAQPRNVKQGVIAYKISAMLLIWQDNALVLKNAMMRSVAHALRSTGTNSFVCRSIPKRKSLSRRDSAARHVQVSPLLQHVRPKNCSMRITDDIRKMAAADELSS